MPKPLAPVAFRRRWTEEDARAALDAFARSGLSMRAFAKAAGINVQRLARWWALTRSCLRAERTYR